MTRDDNIRPFRPRTGNVIEVGFGRKPTSPETQGPKEEGTAQDDAGEAEILDFQAHRAEKHSIDPIPEVPVLDTAKKLMLDTVTFNGDGSMYSSAADIASLRKASMILESKQANKYDRSAAEQCIYKIQRKLEILQYIQNLQGRGGVEKTALHREKRKNFLRGADLDALIADFWGSTPYQWNERPSSYEALLSVLEEYGFFQYGGEED